MKPTKTDIARSVDRPDQALRLYLFYGPDEAGSRALGERLLVGLGGAEKTHLSAAVLKADVPQLAGEAAALSLFGERRLLWIEPGGDDLVEAVKNLLALPRSEHPVVIIAGALRKSSELLKLVAGNAGAIAVISYVPEGRQADELVIDMARHLGLRADPHVASAIAQAAGNDRAIIGQELAKFAAYLDAAPDRPRALDRETVDAVGASLADNDSGGIGDLALSGQMAQLCTALENQPPGGYEAVAIVRALQRRLMMLAPLRARVERGEAVAAVMASPGKPLFWKEKPVVQKMLSHWSCDRLGTAFDRVATFERSLFLSPLPDNASLGELLIGIARAAGRS